MTEDLKNTRIQIRRPNDLPTFGTGEFGSTILADESVGSKNMSVGIVEFDPGASGTRHIREVEEVIFVLEGETAIETDEETYHLSTGEAAIIPSGLHHQHHNVGEGVLRKLWISSPPGPNRRFKNGKLGIVKMSSTFVQNIGEIITGNVTNPQADSESVYIEDSVIREVDSTTTTADTVIDAKGLTLTPGLLDSYVHPVFGDYTPRQQTIDWCESYLHGGVTSMISNGEPHLPGRPDDVESAKALSILARRSLENDRPGGVKVRGGTLILSGEMTEQDIEEVYQSSVKRLKFLTPVENRERMRELVKWGHDRDMIVLMHCGGTSLPGVKSTNAEMFVDAKPDIAAHTNGGPTPVPDAEVEKIVKETSVVLDLVLAGNQRVAVNILKMAADRDELERVQIGTDTPSGTGVTPLGVLLEMAILAGMTDISADKILCMATGNTARHHQLQVGIIEEGRPVDLTLMGAPKGSTADTAISSINHGEYPAIDKVLVDGELLVDRSRNTAPAKKSAEVRKS